MFKWIKEILCGRYLFKYANSDIHMKTQKAGGVSNGHNQTLPMTRQRPPRRPVWIIVFLFILCLTIFGACAYPHNQYPRFLSFSQYAHHSLKKWIVPAPVRLLTDKELYSRTVTKEILRVQSIRSKTPKVAFMFMTPGPLPFEKLWETFFLGHEDMFSIYIHASKQRPTRTSKLFVDRDIHSEKVEWGHVSIVDAELRLLANALLDPDNEHFVLLSDSCIPLHNFDYVYRYLMGTNISFLDSYHDPGVHGAGRYSKRMLPEVEKKDFRKGSQWFTLKRQHVLLILADNLYYNIFKSYCKPNLDGIYCYPDEHYLSTFLHMVDPDGIANRSVTYVNWSERKWHPKSHWAKDTTLQLLHNIKSVDEDTRYSSNAERTVTRSPCMWNGVRRPCFLFARKFKPEALQKLTELSDGMFSNTSVYSENRHVHSLR